MTKITLARNDVNQRLRRDAEARLRNVTESLGAALNRIDALEAALTEIIIEATSRNHAIDIARRARADGGE